MRPFFFSLFFFLDILVVIDVIQINAQRWSQEEWCAVSDSFIVSGKTSEQIVFRDARGKRKGKRGRMESGGEKRLMRLLGFNQYGIWPEDDWKTNLIWKAICLSFISQLSLWWICPASISTFFHLTHHIMGLQDEHINSNPKGAFCCISSYS